MRYVVTITFITPAGAVDVREETVHVGDRQAAERIAERRVERQPGREIIGVELGSRTDVRKVWRSMEDDREVLIVVVPPRDEPERRWSDLWIELLICVPLMVPPAYLLACRSSPESVSCDVPC